MPFQKALLISKETEGFTEIKQAPSEQDFIRVSESYRFKGNDAFITVHHEFHGTEADKIRGDLHSKEKPTIQKIFRKKVKSTRIEAEPTTDLEVSDDLEKNIIVLSGNFSAISALRPNPNTGRMICDFTPYSIFEKIHGIDNSHRIFPVGLCHPTEIFHTIELDHPDAKGTVSQRLSSITNSLHSKPAPKTRTRILPFSTTTAQRPQRSQSKISIDTVLTSIKLAPSSRLFSKQTQGAIPSPSPCVSDLIGMKMSWTNTIHRTLPSP